ncbi:phytanoyl-CoA dioxygenase family protein [Tateyamaria sp. SN6-1]|uniref:phytanoyl-CoA dioxygenase family protein n=1 Tax=Tateyamaria sp. SN6-1 TaxID=3092148 RepID=UPI0039F6223B
MLSAAQISQFHTDGYLVIEDVLPVSCIDAVRVEYADLMGDLYAEWVAQGRVPGGVPDFWDQLSLSYAAGCDWFQPMDISLPGGEITPDCPMHFGPAIFDLVVHDRLLDIVQSLLGPEITSNPIQHVRIKPPSPDLAADEVRAHITATDWHQDRGVGHAEADKTDMVTAWVAITDATEQNGCLQVVPGIDQGLLPHCPQVQTAIAPRHLKTGRAVPLPVRSGGVVLFHPLVPHASLPNMSDGFRWSFDLRYNVTGQHTGRTHFPEFVARSARAPDTVLRDWRAWRQMWFDARDRLAITPHIPIHRWDGTAPYCA